VKGPKMTDWRKDARVAAPTPTVPHPKPPKIGRGAENEMPVMMRAAMMPKVRRGCAWTHWRVL